MRSVQTIENVSELIELLQKENPNDLYIRFCYKERHLELCGRKAGGVYELDPNMTSPAVYEDFIMKVFKLAGIRPEIRY